MTTLSKKEVSSRSHFNKGDFVLVFNFMAITKVQTHVCNLQIVAWLKRLARPRVCPVAVSEGCRAQCGTWLHSSSFWSHFRRPLWDPALCKVHRKTFHKGRIKELLKKKGFPKPSLPHTETWKKRDREREGTFLCCFKLSEIARVHSQILWRSCWVSASSREGRH